MNATQLLDEVYTTEENIRIDFSGADSVIKDTDIHSAKYIISI